VLMDRAQVRLPVPVMLYCSPQYVVEDIQNIYYPYFGYAYIARHLKNTRRGVKKFTYLYKCDSCDIKYQYVYYFIITFTSHSLIDFSALKKHKGHNPVLSFGAARPQSLHSDARKQPRLGRHPKLFATEIRTLSLVWALVIVQVDDPAA
jgi:hypothetical protein